MTTYNSNNKWNKRAKILMLSLPLFATTAFAQKAGDMVSGTVSDSFGPVMMANVVEVDGSNRIVGSTQTDINGNFSFKIKDPRNKLKFSYVGLKTKVVKIAGNTYNVTLEDLTTLKEVVVQSKGRIQGSGLAIPKDQISGASQGFDMKEVEGLAFTTVDEALQGRIAGLDIVAGGNLGSGSTMRLRGVSTVSGSAEPLLVVDGNVMEVTESIQDANDEKFAQLLNVNPEDIESINVLKDAAATAIWGSQGANGVIEIKTKRGSRGKTRVSYSYRITGTWQPQGYKLLTGDEYKMLMKEAYFNPSLNTNKSDIIEFQDSNVNPNGRHNFNKNTDWVDEVTQVGFRQNHYISLTGGGEKANFRIGAGYDHETGTIIKQSLDRLSTRVALDYFVSDRIKIVSNLAFTYTNSNKAYYENLLTIAYKYMPNVSIWEMDDNNVSTGNYFNIPLTVTESIRRDQVATSNNQIDRMNPVGLANLSKNETTNYDIKPEFQIQYNLLGIDDSKTQLKYDGRILFDIANNYRDQFLPNELNVAGWSSELNNRSSAYSYKKLSITTTHTLTFIPHFRNEDHSLMMMLRGRLTDGSAKEQNTSVYRLPNGTITSTNAAGTIDNTSNFSSYASEWKSVDFTYSLHYAYKGKYMFDFSIRRDGVTKFGPGNRWGNFPALSARWNVSKEPWIANNVKWLSMLALRPGWGIVGNRPNDEYLYFSQYNNGSGYMGSTSVNPANIQLKDLRWEKKMTYNLGVDLGFFNDKLTANFEVYKNYTSDLLLINKTIPSSSGFTTLKWHNAGKMENTGWEFNINTNNLVKIGQVGIDFNVTFANNKNILTETDESVLSSYNGDYNKGSGDYLSRVEIGKSVGSIYGFRYKGVYQYSDYTAEEVKGVSGPNAPVVRDRNGNVVLDNNGRTTPMVYEKSISNNVMTTYEFRGGDAIYEDINHDGVINEQDIVYLGSSLPKLTGGFGFKIKWKNFTWNNQFNFRYGNKIINQNRRTIESMTGNANQSAAVNHRWRVEGDIAPIPRAYHNDGSNNCYNALGSDRFVEDGSFIRLNYTQITYNTPKRIIKKLGLSQLNFSVSGNNLLLFTKYSGADPEVMIGSLGLVKDGGQTPRSRSITGSVSIQF